MREASFGRPNVSLKRRTQARQAILEVRNELASWTPGGRIACGARSVSEGLSLPPRSRFRLRKNGRLVPAADVADKADDTVTCFPSLAAAELPGFLIGGADECRPLRWLRPLGGTRRRAHVDHETIVVNGF